MIPHASTNPRLIAGAARPSFLIAGALALLLAAPSPAQPAATPQPAATAGGRAGSAAASTRTRTLDRLARPADVVFTGQPLADVVRFLALQADVPLDPLWASAHDDLGLDPNLPIHLDARDLSVLQCLERMLEDASAAQGLPSGATWQFSPQNRVEFGPRERLNRAEARRIEVYDVRDIVMDVLPPAPAPRLNVEQALGGGQGGSPFDLEAAGFWPPEQGGGSAAELIDLLTSAIEPEQWDRNGGQAASIRYLDGSLVVIAPDYIHRGIAGATNHGG